MLNQHCRVRNLTSMGFFLRTGFLNKKRNQKINLPQNYLKSKWAGTKTQLRAL